MSQREGVPAIADYGLLGDCQSAALVSREGSVDWWCPSRFDAPSAFGRLLDARAGHWSIRPPVAFEVERAYVPETMVLETVFRTAGGVLRLCDALALGSGERGHQIGCRSPQALIRVLDGLEGEVSGLRRVRTTPGVRTDRARARCRGRRDRHDRRRSRWPTCSPAPVALAAGADLRDTPCPVGDRVERRRALTHAGLGRPVVFLGGDVLAPLLDELPTAQSLAEAIDRWDRVLPDGRANAIAAWRHARGLLVARPR